MNTRKIIHAVAAVAMAAAVLVLPQPAQAAPSGACSVEEWRHPGNWKSCASRTREAAAGATGCVTAPTPGSPTSGMAGWFAYRPDSSLHDGVQGQYSIYGVAGYGLDTYDLGCLTTLRHPDAQFWSSMANGEFMAAGAVMGGANWLREHAYDPGSVWGWSDGFIAQSTGAVYKYVFNPFGALALVAVGAFLIWRARHGSLSEAMKLSGWALLVMVVTMFIASNPDRSVHGADSVANSGLAAMHSFLGPAPQNIPADQCKLDNSSAPEACKDSRSVATRASDVATYAVLYRSWLAALLGDPDSEVARKYGPALFDATTMSWGEAARIDGNPTLRAQLIQDKATTFKTIADQIKTEDPLAYEYLQGVHGQDRAAAGAIALLSAFAFALFDSLTSIVILFAFGILRMVIPLVPFFGTVAIFQPASAGFKRIANAAAAALFNIVIFGALAGLNLTADVEIFNSALPGIAKVVIILLLGGMAIFATRPIRKIVTTATGRSRGEPTLVDRAFRASKDIAANRKPITSDDLDDNGRVRPEVRRAERTQAVKTVVGAAYPTAGAVLDHPTVAAGIDAAQQPRPEGDTNRKWAARVGAHMVDATPTRTPGAVTTQPEPAAAPVATAPPAPAPARRRPSPRPRRPETDQKD